MTPYLKLLRDFLYFPTKMRSYNIKAAQNPQNHRVLLDLWAPWVHPVDDHYTPDPRMRACPETLGEIEKTFWPRGKRCDQAVHGWWQLKHCLFSSRTLGKINPFWRAYFSDGLVQPPIKMEDEFGSFIILDFFRSSEKPDLFFRIESGEIVVDAFDDRLAIREAWPGGRSR